MVKELKGLVFVDHKDNVISGKLDATGVDVRGVGLDLLRSHEFSHIAAGYLGQPVSLLNLNQLTREIIIFYRENDQPVVDISIPEQDITDGVVQVVVVEGRVGQVVVEGACFFDPCRLACQPCINSGDPIYESLLMEDLRWLNRSPFREVDLRLRSGDVYGETDIVFDVHDRRPIMLYAGFEDTGVQSLGLERNLYGVVWGNAFDRDHTASFQYTADAKFDQLKAYSASYTIPTLNRNSFTMYGSYAGISSDAAVPFDEGGFAWQTSFRYDYELFPGLCCPRACEEHHLQFGLDFKQSNTNLEFGGINVFNTTTDIFQFMLGYTGRSEDCNGRSSVGIECFISPGGIGSHNNNTEFQLVRPFATADYFYTRANFQRYHYLPHCMALWFNVSGQLAEGNLLSSEQYGFGGYNTVRGYDMRTVNGDSGLLTNVELRTQPFNLFASGCRNNEMQLLAFYDIGQAYNHTLIVGGRRPVTLSGAGIGFRYSIENVGTLRCDYGWQLHDLPVFSNATNHGRLHIGAVMTW